MEGKVLRSRGWFVLLSLGMVLSHVAIASPQRKTQPRRERIATLYQQLYGRFKPKDEYESTAEYSSRLSKAMCTFGDTVFTVPFRPLRLPGANDKFVNLSMRYDADGKVLRVGIPSKECFLKKKEREVNVGGVATASTYDGSNHFGAGVTVIKYRGDEYDISLLWRPEDLIAQIPLTPQQAREVRNNLDIRFVCSIDRSDSTKMTIDHPDIDISGPTLDDPYDVKLVYHLLSVVVMSIEFRDSRTGRVIYTLEP